MMKKANKTVIGAFVLGAVALLAVAIVVFGSKKFFRHSDKYILFFDSSVKGLSEGAPVIFKGVKIGNVSEMSLLYDANTKDVLIPVIIDVELARVEGVPEKLGYPDYTQLIKEGLRARLEVQNFITGQLMLALDFYPDRPVKTYGIIKAYPELPALPVSPDIFEVMEDIPPKEISHNLNEAVSGLNKLFSSEGLHGLKSAVQEITQAARSLRLFLEYMEQHPEAFLKGKQVPGGR